MEKEERAYFNYLVRSIRIKESEKYQLLLKKLWDKEYYSILPNDQNREKDGRFLRDDIDDVLYSDFGPCRVLEMLIALSKRMEYELFGSEYERTYVDLFWEFLENLGLIKFDNLNVLTDAAYLEIDDILTKWLDRKYSADGYGGIFPIKNWQKEVDNPQYKVEIWYQMMLYLSKNYQI